MQMVIAQMPPSSLRFKRALLQTSTAFTICWRPQTKGTHSSVGFLFMSCRVIVHMRDVLATDKRRDVYECIQRVRNSPEYMLVSCTKLTCLLRYMSVPMSDRRSEGDRERSYVDELPSLGEHQPPRTGPSETAGYWAPTSPWRVF